MKIFRNIMEKTILSWWTPRQDPQEHVHKHIFHSIQCHTIVNNGQPNSLSRVDCHGGIRTITRGTAWCLKSEDFLRASGYESCRWVAFCDLRAHVFRMGSITMLWFFETVSRPVILSLHFLLSLSNSLVINNCKEQNTHCRMWLFWHHHNNPHGTKSWVAHSQQEIIPKVPDKFVKNQKCPGGS